MDFQEKTFQHKNVSIKYLEKGSGSTVLFFQGGGVRTQTFDKILNGLALRHHVIAPDVPPFGSASVPKEVWGWEEYGNFFAEFVNSINISDMTAIGFSYGGGIALALATQSPQITRLIIVDAAGKSSGYSERKFRYKYFVSKTFYDLFYYHNIPLFFLIARDFLANRIGKFSQWSHITQIIRKCLLSDIKNLAKIQAKTLILWGDSDEVFPQEVAKRLQIEIPNSSLQFVHGNHDWSFFRYTEMLGLVEKWLESNNS